MINWFKRHHLAVIAVAIFIVQFILGYYGQWHYRYPVAPGDDIYNHLNLISGLQHRPTLFGAGHYPPGFHYLVIAISLLSHQTPLVILTWIWPALLLASGLAIFLLAYQLFGARPAVISYLIYALLSLQPLQTATDGTLANLWAGNFLLPLTILAWAKFWSGAGWRKAAWLAATIIAALLVAYSHHLTTVVLFVVLASTGLAVSINLTWSKRHNFWLAAGVALGYVAILATIAALFWSSQFSAPVRELVKTVSVIAGQDKSWAITAYFTRISWIAGLLGVFGVFYYSWGVLVGKFSQPKKTNLIIILGWALVYLIGSRTSLVGEPERLGRDFAMPVVIIAGLVLSELKWSRLGSLKYLLLAVIILVSARDALIKTRQLTSYDLMVRFSTADAQLDKLVTSGHWSVPVYIWPRNSAWNYVATTDIDSGRIKIIGVDETSQLLTTPGAKCVLASVYQPGTWPSILQDETQLDTLASIDGVTKSLVLADPTKIWYSFCKL